MKVEELITYLNDCDPRADVLLQKDAEGNGFSPLEDIDTEMYYSKGQFSTVIFSETQINNNKETKAKCKKCIVLVPLN